jgi:hypothetical protein
MRLVDIDEGRIVVHLEPSDCLALAQACRAQLNTDRARDSSLVDALAVAFEALGLVGASYASGGAEFWREFTRANVWAHHGPRETRLVGAAHHTDLDGERADETAPACAEQGE